MENIYIEDIQIALFDAYDVRKFIPKSILDEYYEEGGEETVGDKLNSVISFLEKLEMQIIS